MCILYFLSNTIYDVRINSSDEKIVNIIKSELYDSGIYKNKRIRSFEEINLIKNRILDNNREYLEWIEIRNKGLLYIVDVTPRIKHNNDIDNGVSSIYSKYNGVIKHISVYSGEKIVDLNDYVKKGDLLISGNITKDENLVKQVKSYGKVYGEVWYTSKVSVPFKYTKTVKSNKVIKGYYLSVFDRKFTLIGKYNEKNASVSEKLILDKAYLPFKVYRKTIIPYEKLEYNLNYNEAYDLGIKESDKKISQMLGSEEYVISKKVLKKEVNRSKMYIEVFYKIYRDFAYTSNIDKLGEKDGSSN